MKLNYVVIPLIAIVAMAIGSYFYSVGAHWYAYLDHPEITPSPETFKIVWSVLYLLTIISALLVWNQQRRGRPFDEAISLFIVNAFLNATWNWTFFVQHWFFVAIVHAALLWLTIVALLYVLWSRHRMAALLLIPYALWVSFAIILNYQFWLANG